MSLKPDDLLTDRYDIREVVKVGGMGAVYKAYDLRLEGLCAVKEMLASVPAEDEEWVVRRFREEANILRTINHPDVPKVRDFFKIGRLSYIVMDFVEGESLEAELAAAQAAGQQGLPEERVWADALVVLDILAYLHELEPKVIHRDIKPANLIREQKSGRVKLVDFGLARAPSESTQTMAGTFHYCSPEQLHGKAVPQSDLFSLGVTLYQLVSGQIPLLGYFEPLARQVPGINPVLAHAIEKALQPDSRNRPPGAKGMAELLKKKGAARGPARFPRSLVLIGAIALVLLGVLAVYPGSEPAPTPTPLTSPAATP